MTEAQLQTTLAPLIELLSLSLALATFLALCIRSYVADETVDRSQTASRALTTLALSTLSFWLLGYGLAFGHNPHGWFGSSQFAPLRLSSSEAMQLALYAILAACAVQIVQGALGARLSRGAQALLCIGVAGFIMPIFLGWTISSGNSDSAGWLSEFDFIDHAGACFLHALAGWLALIGALTIGQVPSGPASVRSGVSRADEVMEVNAAAPAPAWALLALALLAPGIVSVNLFDAQLGFESSQTLAVNLLLSATSAALVSALFSYRSDTTTTNKNVCNGFVAGLIATSSAGIELDLGQALLNGVIASVLVTAAQRFLRDLGLRDANGAIAVHAIAGTWGVLAAVPFTLSDMHDINRLSVQLVGAVACLVWVGISATILFKLIGLISRRQAESEYSATGSPNAS